MASSEFKQSYNSFSGADIRAVFGTQVIGTLQGISYSVTREKAPIYTMGSPDPRAFARGKRGIAGSLVFIQFDKHALMQAMQSQTGTDNNKATYFWSDMDDLHPGASGIEAVEGRSRTAASDVFFQENIFGSGDPRSDQLAVPAWFSDQIPPFDITLNAHNEYGAQSQMRIWGVEILNEGSGVSIDDIVIEQQMTFVARTISPWGTTGSTAYGDPAA